jgi:hypothetical protein
MKTTITVLEAAPNLQHLIGPHENCEINYCGETFHLVLVEGRNLLLDIKETRVYNKVQLNGWLQDGENIGKAIIELG